MFGVKNVSASFTINGSVEHDIRQPFSNWYAATKWYAALADGSRAQNEMVRHFGFGPRFWSTVARTE